MKRASYFLILLLATASAPNAADELLAHQAAVQRSIDARVRGAAASLDDVLNARPRSGPKSLSVLISFSRPLTVSEAMAFAAKRGASIEGFAHQVGDNFGGYMIPPGMPIDQATVSYSAEYDSFMLGLTQQMETWSKQVSDDATRANVIAQRKRLEQKRGADGHWSPRVTGLYISMSLSELAALRNEGSSEITAIEPHNASRAMLPIPIVAEFSN